MQIDHDCIRALLLYLEDHTGIYKDEESGKYKKFEVGTTQLFDEENLREYGEDTIAYTLIKLMEANFLEGQKLGEHQGYFYNIIITDITWEGHEFLGNIRDETAWNRTKTAAKELGVSSVKGIGVLAWQMFVAALPNFATPENISRIPELLAHI